MTKEVAATRFLVRELAGGDWHESAGVKESGEAGGIRKRTLERAATDVGIEHKREGFPSVTYWRLPSRAIPIPPNDGATVESAWLSQTDRTDAPVTPSAWDGTSDGATARTNGQVPSFGDDGYLDYVLSAFRSGHITTGEALELEQLHELILRGRAVKEHG
jgi:hypothetical protein